MMTVLEQRFMEVATRQLPLLNKNIEKLIKLLEDGTDTRERVRD